MAMFITILAIYTLARYSKRQDTCVSNPEVVNCCDFSYQKAAAIDNAADQGLRLTDDEKQYLMYKFQGNGKTVETVLQKKYFDQIIQKRNLVNEKGQGLDYSSVKTSNSIYNNYYGVTFDPTITSAALAAEIPNLPKAVDPDESLEPSFTRSLSEACIVTIVVYFMGTIMKYAEMIPVAGIIVKAINGFFDSLPGLQTGMFFALCHLIQNMIANTPAMRKEFCKTLNWRKAEFWVPLVIVLGIWVFQEFSEAASDFLNYECEEYCDNYYYQNNNSMFGRNSNRNSNRNSMFGNN